MSIDGSDAFVSCTHEVMTTIILFMSVLVWFHWNWENRCLESVAVFSFLIVMSPVFFLPWYQNTTIRWSDKKCTLHYMGCCVGGRSKVGALCWRNGGSTEYDWYHCWWWGGHLDLQPSLLCMLSRIWLEIRCHCCWCCCWSKYQPSPAFTCSGLQVNEEFLRVLQILSKKLTYVAENSTTKDYAALRDVIPEIEKLRIKAVSKVWNPTSFQSFSGCGDFGVMTQVIVAMRWQQLSLMQFGLCSLFSAVLLFNP